ncbi:unnamed protein product, partial [Mesorhabditis belari]|uniref:Uncharacterized protein n=1 Tax=Mesorhabditis belari TaxID=2138241 RepID=A0AAF3EA61_9BILA
MPFRFLRAFLNQEKTVQQIADSYPVRAAAKTAVRAWWISRHKINNLEATKRLGIFKKVFNDEYQKALKK